MRRVQHEEVGLQIAPMIDVTLLLLFFFMLSGKLTKGAKLLEINIPTAASGKVPREMGDRDVINIDENGQLFQRQSALHVEATYGSPQGTLQELPSAQALRSGGCWHARQTNQRGHENRR